MMVGRRRLVNEFPTPTLTEFETYLQKARNTIYVRQPELAMRDASLLAFEFLFRVRVSEAVGRVYPQSKKLRDAAVHIDKYEGVQLEDFQIGKVKGKKVLRVKFRVLKRGRKRKLCDECNVANANRAKFCAFCGKELREAIVDYRLKEFWEWDSVRLDHPFVHYIMEWLNYLNAKGYHGKVWNISRQRAWQIMRELGIMNHTQRHWRATQLADTMDAFELKEALHRATVPWEYVHRGESKRLQKEKKADKIWA